MDSAVRRVVPLGGAAHSRQSGTQMAHFVRISKLASFLCSLAAACSPAGGPAPSATTSATGAAVSAAKCSPDARPTRSPGALRTEAIDAVAAGRTKDAMRAALRVLRVEPN